MNAFDVRWVQRLSHFSKALGQLSRFIARGELNEFETQGLIQAFEYTYELAWKTLKDYFEAQGETEIHGSRDAFRLAFARGILADGELWMEMIRSRTQTTHTYNEEVAAEIAAAVRGRYHPAFLALEATLLARKA